jgi:hypothetical protein
MWKRVATSLPESTHDDHGDICPLFCTGGSLTIQRRQCIRSKRPTRRAGRDHDKIGTHFTHGQTALNKLARYRHFRCREWYAARWYILNAARRNRYKNVLFDMNQVTADAERKYVSSSLLSTLDHAGVCWVRRVYIGPDGMKLDPFFNIDLNKFPTGPARGHDMLIN